MAEAGRTADSPIWSSRKQVALNVNPNVTAAGTIAGCFFPSTSLVEEVSCHAFIAGTTTTAGIDIYKGTTSIDSITMSSNAAASATLADTTFASTDTLVIKNITSDATMKANVFVVYREIFDNT